MNILRITLHDGTSWYHAKPKLSVDNSLRLTNKIADAQTYTSQESAKLGASNFINKLRSRIRHKRIALSATDHAAMSYFQAGENLVVEICAAAITVRSVEQTITYNDQTLKQ